MQIVGKGRSTPHAYRPPDEGDLSEACRAEGPVFKALHPYVPERGKNFKGICLGVL